MFRVISDDLTRTGSRVSPAFDLDAVDGGFRAPLAAIAYYADSPAVPVEIALPPPSAKLPLYYVETLQEVSLPAPWRRDASSKVAGSIYWQTDDGVYVCGGIPEYVEVRAEYALPLSVGTDAMLEAPGLTVSRVSYRGIALNSGQVGDAVTVDLCCQCRPFVGGEVLEVRGTYAEDGWEKVGDIYFLNVEFSGAIDYVEWRGRTFSKAIAPDIDPGRFVFDSSESLLKLCV